MVKKKPKKYAIPMIAPITLVVIIETLSRLQLLGSVKQIFL